MSKLVSVLDAVANAWNRIMRTRLRLPIVFCIGTIFCLVIATSGPGHVTLLQVILSVVFGIAMVVVRLLYDKYPQLERDRRG